MARAPSTCEYSPTPKLRLDPLFVVRSALVYIACDDQDTGSMTYQSLMPVHPIDDGKVAAGNAPPGARSRVD